MQTRLLELVVDPLLSYTAIATLMSEQFGRRFSKNACIGQARRLNAPILFD